MTKIYGIKDCANIGLYNLADNTPFLFSDYANVSTNEWSAERVFATEKGTNAIAWDGQKKSTVVLETEVFDLKFLALANGADFVTGGADIQRRELVAVTGGKVTLANKPMAKSTQILPVGTNGLEIDGAVALTEVTEEPTSATEYKISETGEITFETSVADGTEFAVHYIETVATAKKLTIRSDVFPKAFRMVLDALIREKERGTDEFVQMEYFNVRPQPNFTLTMSATEITKLSITFDVFPNAKKEMAEYKVVE